MWVVGDRCLGLLMVTLEAEEDLVIRQSRPKLHGRMGLTSGWRVTSYGHLAGMGS